jgi:predicted O-methyltransferase YrrM
MFSFITQVLGGRTDRAVIREVESLRREMLADTRMVKVHDLGAGSFVMRGEERSIRQVAAAAALPHKDAALLARIAGNLDMIRMRERGRVMPSDPGTGDGLQQDKNYRAAPQPGPEMWPGQQPVMDTGAGPRQGQEDSTGQRHPHAPGLARRQGPVILELGTSLGISTLALALAAPDRRVISVEGSPELAAIAGENLRKHGARNAEVLCMEFFEALSHLISLGTDVEMAFIDGNHRGAALAYYVKTIRKMGEEMIIVADDIRMNSDMSTMWQILSGDQQTRTDMRSQTLRASTTGTNGDSETLQGINFQPAPVSVETFRFGMLFFLRNITPGHYRVRC